MNIFSLFTLCGGLAFFLYGMTVMSKSLEKMAGGKLERLLKRMTSNPFKSLLLGAGITIAIQSSSAMTVMLVGLVNSGVMEIGQTIGIIMGSNIGTTLTAWLLSLTGIESENFFVNLLKPENFSPLLALIGYPAHYGLQAAAPPGRGPDDDGLRHSNVRHGADERRRQSRWRICPGFAQLHDCLRTIPCWVCW